MKQDLLLTPKERHTLWERYEKVYPLQDIDWDDIICQAQLAKADPQGAYNRGFEQGKFEERQRIIGIIDNKMDEQRRNYEHTAELYRGFPVASLRSNQDKPVVVYSPPLGVQGWNLRQGTFTLCNVN